jgi:hypothetical protein
MDYQLNLFRQNRENILELLGNITLEQGNTIPEGFRNNVIWNAGHTQVAQEFLLYFSSGMPMNIPEEYLPSFGVGTMAREYSAEEFKALKNHLRQTADKVENDYLNGVFSAGDYKEYNSDYFGPTTRNFKEAFQFNVFHEGVHFGYMLAQLRVLSEGGVIFR